MLLHWYDIVCDACGKSALRDDGRMHDTIYLAKLAAKQQGWHLKYNDGALILTICFACLEETQGYGTL